MKKPVLLATLIAFFAIAPVNGAVLIQENFEDTDFTLRGWYDSPRATLSSSQHISGSTRCFECFFKTGAQGCQGGTPGRYQFAPAETLYLSFWVKYSANYVGSGKPYHPHLFHFVTNKDDKWVGPSYTHLTTYTEQVGGMVRIALQDGRNNDTNCLLLNNGSFIRCNGNVNTYVFTEDRSVCACNGVVGDSGGRDCFNQGDGTYYSARYWDSAEKMFKDEAGPYYKGDWHFIVSCFIMNSIAGGKGVADGVIQYWYDNKLVLDLHHILFRTGKYPDMKFNQFLIAPYIGDGSPVDQYLWIDDLMVSTTLPAAGIKQVQRLYYAADGITARALAGRRIEVLAPETGPTGGEVWVADARGRCFFKGVLNAERTIIRPLFNGVYIVVLKQKNKQVSRKLLVMR